MASFTTGDNIDWLWGSLKPWQILHSTLAERERHGSVLDVWELVNETLSASTTRAQESHATTAPRSEGMNFLGDIIDGDFWRHGGVMESRVKECLNALKDEEQLEAADHALQQLLPSYHHDHYSIRRYGTELTIASCTLLPCAPRSIASKPAEADNQHHCSKVDEKHDEADDYEGMLDEAAVTAVATAAAAAAAEEGIYGYKEEEDEEEEEEEEEQEEDEEEDDDSRSELYTSIIREANYSVISSNYQANPSYRDINRDSASVLVPDPGCTAVAAAAHYDQRAAAEYWGEMETSTKVAERMAAAPDVEENMEVCAVCLEKLTHYYEEGVQALACRHAFHTVCIGPWLQRQRHACCPCCRAPIFPASLEPPLHLGARPVHSAAADHHYSGLHDGYACAGLHEGQRSASGAGHNDIMGLLADMEAALEQLGFRS